MEKRQKLYQSLWSAADELRSQMDANEYKSYLLGLIFYKFLSDNLVMKAADLLGEDVTTVAEAQAVYNEAIIDADPEDREDLETELKYEYSFTLKPELTFQALVHQIETGTFQLDDLQQGFRDIEQSSPAFENLFEDIDLHSKKLGQTVQKQNQTITKIMKILAPLNFATDDGDILGDAYEYMIGQFASESGKKAGEFYSPQSVSKLMTQIAILDKEDKRGLTVYDPTMGSRVIIMTTANSNDEYWVSSPILEK